MSILGTEFIQRFEAYCPLSLAEAGDPVGLHIGTLERPLEKVMLTLDVRPETVAEAIERGVDLIVAKHPPIFRPISRLTTDQPQIKMYQDLLQHNIAVYAAHTNLDIIDNGLNDWFCEELGIHETRFLKQTHEIPYLKLVTFVPLAAAETVRQALSAAGAGQVGGNYEQCSFSVPGEGRFTPIAAAQPAIGSIDQATVVTEERIEMLVLETDKQAVLKALLAAHPYEEVAYDLLPLANQGRAYGIGRVGNLAEPVPLAEFIQRVKTTFKLDGLRLVSQQPEQMIQRVAICGGSGEKFYPDALAHQADVYITGDVYYHTAHDMLAAGLTVIDPGHHIEVLCQERLLELCQQWQQEFGWDVEFVQATANTNPFQYY